MIKKIAQITFPSYSGIRCLMMPYIQGEPRSIPETYVPYHDIIKSVFLHKGDIGFLTIDESPVSKGEPHRGARLKYGRALHTEAGKRPYHYFAWGGGAYNYKVTLDRDVKILLANNLNASCTLWDSVYENTTLDGDIGHMASSYPYSDATFMRPGEVYEIGILTPHESVPVEVNFQRQFLRIVSSGVHGREEYFTKNPLVPWI